MGGGNGGEGGTVWGSGVRELLGSCAWSPRLETWSSDNPEASLPEAHLLQDQ